MAIKKQTADPMLAMEFKRAICDTFCREDLSCANCQAQKIGAKTYGNMRIRDLIWFPRKRRRK